MPWAFLASPTNAAVRVWKPGLIAVVLSRAIYEQTAGLILPRNAAQQAAATEKISRNELQPGDLVFFNTMRRAFSHVGIYIGNGKFIHSPKPGAEVRVEDMGIELLGQSDFDGARRVAAEQSPDATAN